MGPRFDHHLFPTVRLIPPWLWASKKSFLILLECSKNTNYMKNVFLNFESKQLDSLPPEAFYEANIHIGIEQMTFCRWRLPTRPTFTCWKLYFFICYIILYHFIYFLYTCITLSFYISYTFISIYIYVYCNMIIVFYIFYICWSMFS